MNKRVKKKRYIFIITLVLLLLLIPLIAMQLTNDVYWTLADFIIAAVLLLSTALSIDAINRNIKKTHYRIILIVVIITILLLLWAELAVGLFGTFFSGN